MGSAVHSTSSATSENKKKIIINIEEEKNIYTSIFFFSFAEAFSVIFWWEVGNKTQDDFLNYTNRRKCYPKHLGWQRPRSMYVYAIICQILKISLANELKFTHSTPSYLLTKALQGCSD